MAAWATSRHHPDIDDVSAVQSSRRLPFKVLPLAFHRLLLEIVPPETGREVSISLCGPQKQHHLHLSLGQDIYQLQLALGDLNDLFNESGPELRLQLRNPATTLAWVYQKATRTVQTH